MHKGLLPRLFRYNEFLEPLHVIWHFCAFFWSPSDYESVILGTVHLSIPIWNRYVTNLWIAEV